MRVLIVLLTISLGCAAAAYGQLAVGVDNTTQAIQIYDFGTNSYITPISVGIGVRGLAADEANRKFYFTSGSRLYSVGYDAPHTVTDIAAFNGAVTGISGGLAYDSVNQILYGSTTTSFYSINTTTATTALVFAVGAGDFGGFDYDSASGKFYATNDSTSTAGGLTGRGIYEITLTGTPSAVEIVDYPEKTTGVVDTDIDGCAAGGGKVYPCADETNWAYIYNLGTPGYETPIAQPFGTDKVFSGATWAPGALSSLPNDVQLGKTASAPCPLQPGATVTYTINVKNAGPTTVTGVTVTDTLPAGVTFVSVDPPGSHSSGVITANIGTMTSGQAVTFDIVVTVDVVGPISNTADVTLNEVDPILSNNTATATVNVTDASRLSTAVVSTIASAPTSDVPGMPGVKWETLDRGFRSPGNVWWILSGDTNAATTVDELIVRSDFSSTAVIVQEGVTATTDGDIVGLIDTKMSVNDAGQVAFATNTDAATNDEIIALYDTGVVSDVAREGEQVFALAAGINHGIDLNSPNIFSNGKVAYNTTLAGGATGDAWISDSGSTLVAQTGVTVPAGQAGGGAEFWENLDFGEIHFDAGGTNYIGEGDLTGVTTSDDLAAVNGTVVVQEGSIVPGSGFGSPADQATPLAGIHMEATGDWLARGDNDDDQDWVLRNGVVIAKSGDPIVTPSTGETYGDSSFADTFFINVGNNAGDYFIGGVTNAADDLANAVLVMNGTTLLSRENDPVDVDGDGTFNDDTYIRTYGNDDAFVTDDALYVVVTLRNSAGYCTGVNTDLGDALIRIPLPATCVPCDTNCDGTVNPFDIQPFIELLSGSGPPPCSPCSGDANSDGTVNPFDINAFLGCLGA